MIEIEEKQKDVVLQLGDIVTKDNYNFVGIVIKTWKRMSNEEIYVIKDIYNDIPTVQFGEETLEELTERALMFGYKIYSQDEYRYVIKRKSFVG